MLELWPTFDLIRMWCITVRLSCTALHSQPTKAIIMTWFQHKHKGVNIRDIKSTQANCLKSQQVNCNSGESWNLIRTLHQQGECKLHHTWESPSCSVYWNRTHCVILVSICRGTLHPLNRSFFLISITCIFKKIRRFLFFVKSLPTNHTLIPVCGYRSCL